MCRVLQRNSNKKKHQEDIPDRQDGSEVERIVEESDGVSTEDLQPEARQLS